MREGGREGERERGSEGVRERVRGERGGREGGREGNTKINNESFTNKKNTCPFSHLLYVSNCGVDVSDTTGCRTQRKVEIYKS